MSTRPINLQKVSCTYCRNTKKGPDGLHAHCPGAVRIPGTERVIVCGCCTPKTGMCTTCGNRQDQQVDPITWYCYDRFACSARVQVRCQQSPLFKQLQECRLEAAVKRRADGRDRGRIRSGIDPADPDEVDSFETAMNGKPRRSAASARPKSGSCACCGEPTKGGRFLPGHDAKMVSRLIDRIDKGDATAWDEVTGFGWDNKRAFASRQTLRTPVPA